MDSAEVEVVGSGGEIVGRATTVADGRFSVVQLPAGNYRLTVTTKGYRGARLDHQHPGGRVHVELQPARVTGTVTPADAAPGDQVVADVIARDAEGHVRARTQTDVHGRFALDGLSAGLHEVAASSDGYFTTRRQVDLERQVDPLELELVPAELLGRVHAEESGEPILDAQAKLRSTDGTLVGQSVTDPAGRFLIPLASLAAAGSTAGATHSLEVTADGFEPAEVDLTLTEDPVEELSVTLSSKRPPWLWVGVGVALLALLGLLFALLSGEDTTVPDLTGTALEEAADLLEAEELVLGEVTFTDADAGTEPGTVLSSDPEAGETAAVGDAVDLTASPIDDPTVEVPRVTGRQESDAVRLLDALEFDVVISRVASDEAAGLVVAQLPPPRTEVPVGAEVSIDISQGPGEEEPAPEQEPVEPEPEPVEPESEPVEPEPEPTEPEPEQEPEAEPEPDQEPVPGAGEGGGDGAGPDLPDVDLPDVDLPDVELPDVDTEELRGFFDRIVEWFRNTFSG